MNVEIIAAVVGAFAGGFVGLVMNELLPRLRVNSVSESLSFKIEKCFGSRSTARVINDSDFPMHDVWAYITIEHAKEDIEIPPAAPERRNGNLVLVYVATTISPSCWKIVKEDRLCWSRLGHPASVDIYAGEQQLLDICEFSNDGNWIQFPSETGYGTCPSESLASRDTPVASRVFLKAHKTYFATIGIVSADTKRRDFRICIDPKARECTAA